MAFNEDSGKRVELTDRLNPYWYIRCLEESQT